MHGIKCAVRVPNPPHFPIFHCLFTFRRRQHAPWSRVETAMRKPEMPSRYLQIKLIGPNLACVCHIMHAGLITIYVALIFVASQHHEHNINFPFTSIGQITLSTTVMVITQTFSIVRSP